MGLGGRPRTQANETTFETSRPASCCRQRGPHPAACTVPVLVSSLWASRPDDACQRGTGRQIVSRTTRAASADSEVRPDPGPTLRSHHRQTSEAGPEHYPHPPCRLFTGSGARSLVVALCADLTFMYLFELVAGDLCGPVTWSGATSAVAHLSLLGSAGVVWPGAAGCRYGWLRRVKRWGGPHPGAGWWRWISDVVWGAAGFVRAGVVWGGGVCSFLVRAHRARPVRRRQRLFWWPGRV